MPGKDRQLLQCSVVEEVWTEYYATPSSFAHIRLNTKLRYLAKVRYCLANLIAVLKFARNVLQKQQSRFTVGRKKFVQTLIQPR